MLYINELDENNGETRLLEFDQTLIFTPRTGEELYLRLAGEDYSQAFKILKVRHHLVVGRSYDLEILIKLVGTC